jgi:hypothetical protein
MWWQGRLMHVFKSNNDLVKKLRFSGAFVELDRKLVVDGVARKSHPRSKFGAIYYV